MKRIVLTTNQEFSNKTSLAYANKHNLEHSIVEDKFTSIKKYINKGYEVLWLDSTTIVSPNAPNIFDHVKTVGIFDETPFLKSKDKSYNLGVIVLKKRVKSYFDKKGDLDLGKEKSITFISHIWNRCPTTWLKPLDPFGSYIINFGTQLPEYGKDEYLEARYKEWEDHNFEGKEWFSFICSGGMGNQLATCPTVEEVARNHLNANISIYTPYPDAFNHLTNKYKLITVEKTPSGSYSDEERDQFNAKLKQDLERNFSSMVLETHGKMPLNMLQMNSVDYHSLSVLGRQLEDRTINIYTKDNEKIIEDLKDKKVAIIHAGLSGWVSKDAPKEVYQTITDRLKDEGYFIVQVGKEKMVDHGKGWGAMDLENIDYNLLNSSFEDFMTAMKQADLIVTNDSMPVHAAGATNAWIACLTISKHPNLIKPIRRIDVDHKFIPLTSKQGHNQWDVVSRSIAYLPTDRRPSVDEWVEGMKWESGEYYADQLIRAITN